MSQGSSGNSENFDLSDFFKSEGLSIEERVAPFSKYFRETIAKGDAHYLRSLTSKSAKRTKVLDAQGNEREMWMLGSNSYLDFSAHPYVIKKVQEVVQEFGVGVGGPPLLNGMTLQHQKLEQRLAKLKGQEDALIFSSGFQANLGWITALIRSGDHLVYDEFNHASLYDGILLAKSHYRFKSHRFSHNNIKELQEILEKLSKQEKKGITIVAVEGVYSMDGDLAPLNEISHLCEQYGAYLMVDDAHGTGVLGKLGQGTAHHFGVENKVAIAMGTFSKTFGVTGGFISGQKELIDYLRFYSRSYMFSAHLPISTVAAVSAGLDLLEREPDLVQKLKNNAQYFVNELCKIGYKISTESAIIPIPIPAHVDIRMVNKRFHELGVFLNSIEFPAVPLTSQRLRISMVASLTQAELDQIISIFVTVGKEFGLIP